MSNRIGRYEIRSRLGSGAFATVYEAFDPRLESSVAIKLLADNWIHEPDVRARFRQEAVLLRRVQTEHPTAPLLDVYDIDETDDGRPFFVMRLADQGSLADRIRAQRTWPPSSIAPVVAMLHDALGTLHEAGIVHRDVKPSNLMLTSATGASRSQPRSELDLVGAGERVLLGDLGLAKDQLISGSALTIAGGTPRYMAPEQRDPAAAIDHRADLYAATVLVLDLLTGHPDLAGSPERLDDEALTLLRTGLAPSPSDRFADAASWAGAMHRVLAAFEMPSAQPTPSDRDRTAIAPPARPVSTATAGPVNAAGTVPVTAPDQARQVASPVAPLAGRLAAGIAAAVLFVAVLVGLALRGGNDSAILGPTEANLGETVVLFADAEPGDQVTWTVGGRQVINDDLVLTPDRAGFIDVELTIVDADGESSTSTQRVTVSE